MGPFSEKKTNFRELNIFLLYIWCTQWAGSKRRPNITIPNSPGFLQVCFQPCLGCADEFFPARAKGMPVPATSNSPVCPVCSNATSIGWCLLVPAPVSQSPPVSQGCDPCTQSEKLVLWLKGRQLLGRALASALFCRQLHLAVASFIQCEVFLRCVLIWTLSYPFVP